MAHRIIANEADLIDLHRLLGRFTLPITVEWVQGRDRTGEQNKLQWLWANEAAMQLGDRTAAEMQREWKLRFGVPILREASPEFRATYDKHNPREPGGDRKDSRPVGIMSAIALPLTVADIVEEYEAKAATARA